MNMFLKYSLVCLTLSWLLIFFIGSLKGKRWKHASIYFAFTTGITLFAFYFLHYDIATRLADGSVWSIPIGAQLILVFTKFVFALWVVIVLFQKKGVLQYATASRAQALNAALAILMNWSLYEYV